MTFNMNEIDLIRRGSAVRRYHCYPLLNPDTVGKHTFNLIGILRACVPVERLTVALLLAAHEHDVPEYITGDMPAPFKRNIEGFRSRVAEVEQAVLDSHGMKSYEAGLSATEKRWLKLADSLEGAAYCLDERELGSRVLDGVLKSYFGYVNELLCEYSNEERDEAYDNFRKYADRLHSRSFRGG